MREARIIQKQQLQQSSSTINHSASFAKVAFSQPPSVTASKPKQDSLRAEDNNKPSTSKQRATNVTQKTNVTPSPTTPPTPLPGSPHFPLSPHYPKSPPSPQTQDKNPMIKDRLKKSRAIINEAQRFLKSLDSDHSNSTNENMSADSEFSQSKNLSDSESLMEQDL